VNDTLGHLEGDRLLKVIGEALRESLRQSDVVARLGGDEFAIALPETDAMGARGLVDKLRHHVGDRLAGSTPVTLSVGVVSLGASDVGLAEVIRRADALMYQAKRAGKDTAVFGTLDTLPSAP
jgi:diguanylate cyclase (GGDEF)-like protein